MCVSVWEMHIAQLFCGGLHQYGTESFLSGSFLKLVTSSSGGAK
jgi:hypothetical protein